VAEPLRNAGKYTMADVLAYRLSPRPVRAMASLSTLTVSTFYMIAQMVGAGALVSLLLKDSGITYRSAVIGVGALMIIYVVFGGMLATTWVQIIKAILLMAGTLMLSLLVLGHFGMAFEGHAATVVDIAQTLASQRGDEVGVDMLFWAQAIQRSIESHRRDATQTAEIATALNQRLAALERTRQSEQWVFLDAFPRHAVVIARARVARRPEMIGAMLDEARFALDVARVRLASRPHSDEMFEEREFLDLEDAGNRFAEIRRALDDGRDLRVPHDLFLPARSDLRPVVLGPSSAALAARLVAAREREEAYGRVLKRLHGYHVVTRNCVSEILDELDVALLGERVDMDGSLSFVPAVSAAVVKERYGVSDVFRILSHRRAGLARLYEEENSVRVFLRESNTITSTLYWRNSRDSTFIFFTDDLVVTRPVFGAANLVASVAASAVGLVTAPFDSGKLLRASLRGAFFSLPELFFQNIRKGSFEYVGHATREGEAR